MEAFLKKQAEIEGSGVVGATATATVEQVAADAESREGARAGPGGDEGAVLGADVVSDDVSSYVACYWNWRERVGGARRDWRKEIDLLSLSLIL